MTFPRLICLLKCNYQLQRINYKKSKSEKTRLYTQRLARRPGITAHFFFLIILQNIAVSTKRYSNIL